MTEKQKVFDYLKHGFTADDVWIRLTPQSKKSITHMIQVLTNPMIPNRSSLRSGRPTDGDRPTWMVLTWTGHSF